MNAWHCWLAVGLFLAGTLRGEEKPAKKNDPTHRYYAVFKGVKNGKPKLAQFQVQAEWTLQGGLRKMDKVMEVPVERDEHIPTRLNVLSDPAQGYIDDEANTGGWFSPGEGLVFREDAGGMKRGYPPPYFWDDPLAAGVGSFFDAAVSSVGKADDGRALVNLVLLKETNRSTGKEKTIPKKTVSIVCDERQGPIPIIKGQKVSARVSAQGEVLWVNYGASARLWRKAPDGKIEIAVNPDPDPKRPSTGLLLLKPAGLQQGSTDVNWIPRLGVFLFQEAAGYAELDSTKLPGDAAGIQLLNVPDVRIRPGRDGWQRAKHSEEGYWENCPEVSESQETPGAG